MQVMAEAQSSICISLLKSLVKIRSFPSSPADAQNFPDLENDIAVIELV